MAQKEHSLSKFVILIICFITFGCNPKDKNANTIFEKVDVSQIPNITIFENDAKLNPQNGVYYFNNKPFSGYIKSNYNFDSLKSTASYFQGKQHGITQTFFSNGKLETERNYKNGIGYGRHFGYWENGNMKFDFTYYDDKREGIQKQWYESGSKYYELSFSGDRENGMQKAWRENGKPYINYEVKDGVRYGLQKSALCYTLKNEQLK
jgi:antitoxin component YwqK of YwqJK toxin-antitoxin module